ncbi:MAG: carbohydrate ABC transporter permease [Anaerolineae bacterium]|nr:carbohydrate ABC transporter permease [Anaerolineae bacterium]
MTQMDNVVNMGASLADTLVARRTKSGIWNRRTRRYIGHAVAYFFMTACCFVFLIPLVWMISTALKDRGSIWLWPPKWIPDPIEWHNCADVFNYVPFGIYLRNTLVIAFCNIVGHVWSVTLVAYSFARLRFRGRDFLFIVLLATLMIPGEVTMIPRFIMFKLFGWYDTYLPLIVPAFTGGPFMIFLVRQYLMTIPYELDEAATIDGCSRLQILYKILFPIIKPPVTLIIVWTFIGSWNDLMGPVIYLTTQSKYTLAIGLTTFYGQQPHSTLWNLLMAASVMSVIPLLVIYYFAQDYLIGGIASVGLKG